VGFYDREALAALVDAREILREAGQQEGDAAVVGAGDGAGFRRAVRLTSLWCLVFSAGVSAIAFAGGRGLHRRGVDEPGRARGRPRLPALRGPDARLRIDGDDRGGWGEWRRLASNRPT